MTQQKKLDVFIDGLVNGGAENLLSQLLPLLKTHFSVIEVHCLKGEYALEDKFRKDFLIVKHKHLDLFKKIISASSTSYIHLGCCSLFSYIALIIRSWFKCNQNFIIHLHTSLQFHRLKDKTITKKVIDVIYLFFLKKTLKKNLCKLILTSLDQFQEMSTFLGGNNKLTINSNVFILPNTFTNEYIQKLRNSRVHLNTQRPLVEKEITFFTLSRLISLKQIDWAIKAAYEAAKYFPEINFKLNIFGIGPEKDTLQKVIDDLVPLVNFKSILCGFASITHPLSASDIYLFPSKIEGSPLSLAEAALSGIRCVANDCTIGPKYLSTFFQNIYLSSPPTQENFISSTIFNTKSLLEGSFIEDKYKKTNIWPSLEDMGDQLADFLKR